MDTAYPLYSKFDLDDMTVLYLSCRERLIFCVIPADMADRIPVHRRDLNDTVGFRNYRRATGADAVTAGGESMIQLHLMGDPFAYDDTMRNGPSVAGLRLVSQTKEGDRIVTVFADGRGIEAVQTLEHRPGEKFVTVSTSVVNRSEAEIELGMVESASLGMLTSPLLIG